jgi:hypothetical protein
MCQGISGEMGEPERKGGKTVISNQWSVNAVKLRAVPPTFVKGGRGGFFVTALKSPFSKGGLKGKILNLTALSGQ